MRKLISLLAVLCMLLCGCSSSAEAVASIAENFDEYETEEGENTPMVALTFDDGPSIYTARILDLLKQYSGKATFCLIGNRIDSFSDTVRRTIDEGHELAVHSWDHRQLTSIGSEKVKEEIISTMDKIKEFTGKDCKVLRPTYGSVNDKLLTVAKELDLIIVNWSIDTLDWKTKNADATYKEIMSNVQDGAIILCHDLFGETVDAMERVIPALVEKGYKLVTVTELLTSGERTVKAGTLYKKRTD